MTAAPSFDFDYFQSLFVISTIASALGTEIDLDVVDTSGSGPYSLHSLKPHRCSASGTAWDRRIVVSGWIFTRFSQQFSQAADVGQSIKQFKNEDPNHAFELGLPTHQAGCQPLWTSILRRFGTVGDIYKG